MPTFLPVVASSQTPAPSAATFQSGGKPIRVEVFYPPTSGRHPAVLVLYGGLGMTLRPAGYRYYAADLAKHGYAAFLVHYFDRTSEEKTRRTRPHQVGTVAFHNPRRHQVRIQRPQKWIPSVSERWGFPQFGSRAGRSGPGSANQSDKRVL